MEKLKVSFIIPLFNSENYILETLDSILCQSYKNIEVIVVDDGSSDNSYNLVKNLSDKRVILLSQKNQGACKARNFGFSKSDGELIQFFDSDDLITKDYVAEKVRIFEKTNFGTIVTSPHYRFNDDISKSKLLARPLNRNYDSGVDLILDMALNWKFYQVSAWMVSRELFLKSEGWDEKLKRNQDGELFFRLLLLCDRVSFAEKPKSYYRLTVGSITTSGGADSLWSFLSSVDKYRDGLLAFEDSARTRKAIASFYTNLMYLTVLDYPDITRRIEERICEIGQSKRVGDMVILNICTCILGFKNLVRLIRLFKNSRK